MLKEIESTGHRIGGLCLGDNQRMEEIGYVLQASASICIQIGWGRELWNVVMCDSCVAY